MKDHLKEELMKRLIANAQVKILVKLMTNKLGSKLILKFLEVFFEEFNIALWISRYEQMIVYERWHGIASQHKQGIRTKCQHSVMDTTQTPLSPDPLRTRTPGEKERLKQLAMDQKTEAYIRCERMILQYIEYREIAGWAGII